MFLAALRCPRGTSAFQQSTRKGPVLATGTPPSLSSKMQQPGSPVPRPLGSAPSSPHLLTRFHVAKPAAVDGLAKWAGRNRKYGVGGRPSVLTQVGFTEFSPQARSIPVERVPMNDSSVSSPAFAARTSGRPADTGRHGRVSVVGGGMVGGRCSQGWMTEADLRLPSPRAGHGSEAFVTA